MDEKLALLRTVPLFVGLDDDELKAVGALTTEVDKPAGSELAREETFGSEFYMIIDGTVRIHRAGATLRNLGPGDFLGEIALIDHGRRTASATAETDCRLLVLGHREFHSLMEAYPEFRMRILEGLAAKVRRLEENAVH